MHNYHDRGLTGVAVDPQFGTAGHNYIYVNYAYDRDPRDEPAIVPKWGTGGGGYDDCAAPAAMGPPVVTGCVGVTRVSRIPVALGANGWVNAGAEQPLVDLPGGQAACQQFGSHASGDVVFGPDGMLYASAGDGASFDSLDYGQAGNPCGDPVNEGGGLRAQDIRTSGDPLGLGGTIFRINPNGGQVAAGRAGQRLAHRHLRPAQPVAADLPARHQRAVVRRRRRERLGGGQPDRHVDVLGPGQPRLAVLRGRLLRRAEAGRLGRARQADLREPLRRGGRAPRAP